MKYSVRQLYPVLFLIVLMRLLYEPSRYVLAAAIIMAVLDLANAIIDAYSRSFEAEPEVEIATEKQATKPILETDSA